MRNILIATAMMLLLAGAGICTETGEKISRAEHIKGPKNDATTSMQSAVIANGVTLPLRIQIVPPPKDEPEYTEFIKDQSRKTRMEIASFAIAGLTFLVLVFQLIVFGRQARRLRETVEATEKAAKAAQDSADGLVMIERAYVFASIRIENGALVVDLKNHGKTPAILKSLFVTRKFHPMPPQEIDDRLKSIIPDGVVIGSNEVWPATITPSISEYETQMLDRQDFKLFCFGVVEYLDVLKQKRPTGFCWQFNYKNGAGDWSIADSKLNHYD